MNNLNFEKITESLINVFLEAGQITKDISKKGIEITIKPDKSPVTNADLAVDKILSTKIKNLTPEIPIISEETVDLDHKNESTKFWLIDPIDGTRDYIKKRDEYTINAALIIDLKPAVGIIYAPAKNRLFYSYGKNFAYEIFNEKTKKLECKKKFLDKVIGLENSNNTPDEVLKIYKKNKVSETIKMSSSLKFCVLAAGEADIYAATARAFEWDIAAGHAILNHAGGFVTTHDEKEFKYGKKNFKNLPIIAKRSNSIDK